MKFFVLLAAIAVKSQPLNLSATTALPYVSSTLGATLPYMSSSLRSPLSSVALAGGALPYLGQVIGYSQPAIPYASPLLPYGMPAVPYTSMLAPNICPANSIPNQERTVCCPKGCSVCGGKLCGQRKLGGENCCGSVILQSGKTCGAAPCIIARAAAPVPATTPSIPYTPPAVTIPTVPYTRPSIPYTPPAPISLPVTPTIPYIAPRPSAILAPYSMPIPVTAMQRNFSIGAPFPIFSGSMAAAPIYRPAPVAPAVSAPVVPNYAPAQLRPLPNYAATPAFYLADQSPVPSGPAVVAGPPALSAFAGRFPDAVAKALTGRVVG